MTTSLGEQYPKEQARCRELLVAYKQIGSSGIFGAMHIERVLALADRAVASGDVVKMIHAYDAMTKCG